jgi:uncharacterized membrane protein
MSWNPNQGQDPNQPSQYGTGYTPPSQPNDPYSQQYGGYQQQSGSQQQGGYQQQQQGGYQDPYSRQQANYQQQQAYGSAASASAFGPSTMSMDAKTAAGLSYLGVWVTGLVFFLLEKQNRFVRFHAMQSIIFFGGLSVVWFVLGFAIGFLPFPLSFALSCLSGLIGIGAFVGWIVLMINAFQGKYFKLPVVGDYAERYANSNML